MLKKRIWAGAALLGALSVVGPASADSADPDLIFRKSTTFRLLTPNDKLAVYGIDDPTASNLPLGARARNQSYMGNLIWKTTPHVNIAWEFRRMLTNFRDQPSATLHADTEDLAVAYIF